MVSFIILLIARTARIAVRTDRQTDRKTKTERQNDKPSTVTIAAHARRGLISASKIPLQHIREKLLEKHEKLGIIRNDSD